MKLTTVLMTLVVMLLTTSPSYAGEIYFARKTIVFPAGKDAENIHNAGAAAEYINGTVLKPGEAFSFNEVVGPRTLDRGFAVGHNAAYQPDLGSGICREATVLYQLVKNIGITVTERETHYPPVDYADPDNDAAIVWGYCDLKFINTLPCDVLIRTGLKIDETGYHLWAGIWKCEAGQPVKVITVSGHDHNQLAGTIYGGSTYVPVENLACGNPIAREDKGLLAVILAGKTLNELDGDIVRDCNNVLVRLRAWANTVDRKLTWVPTPGPVVVLEPREPRKQKEKLQIVHESK